jgi:hypothetical protein
MYLDKELNPFNDRSVISLKDIALSFAAFVCVVAAYAASTTYTATLLQNIL